MEIRGREWRADGVLEACRCKRTGREHKRGDRAWVWNTCSEVVLRSCTASEIERPERSSSFLKSVVEGWTENQTTVFAHQLLVQQQTVTALGLTEVINTYRHPDILSPCSWSRTRAHYIRVGHQWAKVLSLTKRENSKGKSACRQCGHPHDQCIPRRWENTSRWPHCDYEWRMLSTNTKTWSEDKRDKRLKHDTCRGWEVKREISWRIWLEHRQKN